MRSKVIRVWGRADNFNIEFSFRKSTGKWECTVPPDTKDGQYALELFAYNEAGKTSYYTGILYMCSGVCHISIKTRKSEIGEENFACTIHENVCLKVKKVTDTVGYFIRVCPKYRLKIERGCVDVF